MLSNLQKNPIMKLTLEEIQALRADAKRLKLDGHEKLDKYTDEELQSIYNGIGPNWMKDGLVEVITALHAFLGPAALIHDVDYKESDRLRSTFYAANARLQANGYILADDRSGWYNPRRYWHRFKAWRARKLCDAFGWSAFAPDLTTTPQSTPQ